MKEITIIKIIRLAHEGTLTCKQKEMSEVTKQGVQYVAPNFTHTTPTYPCGCSLFPKPQLLLIQRGSFFLSRKNNCKNLVRWIIVCNFACRWGLPLAINREWGVSPRLSRSCNSPLLSASHCRHMGMSVCFVPVCCSQCHWWLVRREDLRVGPEKSQKTCLSDNVRPLPCRRCRVTLLLFLVG